jgi:glycosyltransferase involved in cell wall biosynthesis
MSPPAVEKGPEASSSTDRLIVCYFGTYSAGEGYPVNRILIDGLRRAGATVWECRAEVTSDEGAAVVERWKSAHGQLAWLRLAARSTAAWCRLAARWMSGPPTDVVIVGYPGHLDVFLAKALTRRPVVLNALLSLHDTVVNDRGLIPARSLGARTLHALDRLACRAADLVFLDTQAHINHFCSAFRLSADRFHRVFVGSDRATKPSPTQALGAPCRILFVGTFIPLHGVVTILGAAKRLQEADSPVAFRLIGWGQDFTEAAERVRREGLSHVELIGRWIGPEEYERELADADICLGIFGATAKAQRVIPSKVFDALAAGRPIVTADTPAARELLNHGEDAWLCPPADPDALADALRTLARNPALRARLAGGARRTFEARCSPDVIGREVRAALERLVRLSL